MSFVDADNPIGTAVHLEPITESVSEELLTALLESRADLRRYMSWDCSSIEDVEAFIEGAIRDRADRTRLEFAIRKKADNSLLGVIGLKNFDPFTPKAEMGYWVRSSMTGNGYATDAARTLLDYCENELKLARVDACAAETNTASQRVLLKCGFEREGSKRKSQLCHGTWLDMALFGKILAWEC